jgi:bacillolysin
MKNQLLKTTTLIVLNIFTSHLIGQSTFKQKTTLDTTFVVKPLSRTFPELKSTSDRNALLSFNPNPTTRLMVGQKSASTNSSARVSSIREVIYSPQTQLPSWIKPAYSHAKLRSSTLLDIEKAVFDYLNEIKSTLKVKDPKTQFKIVDHAKDELGKTHVKLAQVVGDIPVYGAEIMIHFNANNLPELFNGNYQNVAYSEAISFTKSTQEALLIVKEDLSTHHQQHGLSQTEKDILGYQEAVIDTVLYQPDQGIRKHYLVYQISLHASVNAHWDYFIDVKTGDILDKFTKICSIDGPRTAQATDLSGKSRTIFTYQFGTNYRLFDASRTMFNASKNTGVIETLDAKNTFGSNYKFTAITSTNNLWNNPTAVAAHYNAGVA